MHAAALNLGLLCTVFMVGAVIAATLTHLIQREFWRAHDRRTAERIDQMTRRLDALHDQWWSL